MESCAIQDPVGNEKQSKAEFLKTREVPHYLNSCKDGDYVLLVGEGNFSFSAFLIQHTKAHIVATTLLLPSQILSERAKKNILLIQKFGGSVHTDVDATHLITHNEVNRHIYKVIIFNFPHIPGKMKIGANRDLLRNFFMSAKKVIENEGEVHVTLCKGQGGTMADVCQRKWENTWQITSMAAFSDFILYHVEPFHVEDYPGYTCSGYRGCEKSFCAKMALTHIFKLGHPIMTTLKTLSQPLGVRGENPPLISTHIELCKKYKSVFETSEHPIAKTLSSLINEIKKCSSSSLQIISYPDLLICPGKSCLKCNLECSSAFEVLPCTVPSLLLSTSCISQVLEQQLNTETDVFISSYVCCPYGISASELPLSCSAIFMGRSLKKIINELYVTLNKLLCSQNLCDSTDNNFCVSGLFEDVCHHQSNLENPPQYKDLQHTENIKFEEIGTIFLFFNVIRSTSHALRKDLRVMISEKNPKHEAQKNVLKLGNVYAVLYKQTISFCTSLAVECVSMAKFHVFNHNLFLSDMAYFDTYVHDDAKLHMIYRSASLYPAFYIHDVSFWLPEGFQENELILLMKNLVGDIICDIRLIDSYYDELFQKRSHCYRFIYQSCDRPLSKEKTQYIHTNIIRHFIEKYLNVKLR